MRDRQRSYLADEESVDVDTMTDDRDALDPAVLIGSPCQKQMMQIRTMSALLRGRATALRRVRTLRTSST